MSIKKKNNNSYKNGIMILALVIASLLILIITGIFLLMPAVTLGNEPICGLEEHKHDDSCYEYHKVCDYGFDSDLIGDTVLKCNLVCTDGTHQHTEECYHTHTQDCFSDTLICTLPEHAHDSSCYIEEEGAITEMTEEEMIFSPSNDEECSNIQTMQATIDISNTLGEKDSSQLQTTENIPMEDDILIENTSEEEPSSNKSAVKDSDNNEVNDSAEADNENEETEEDSLDEIAIDLSMPLTENDSLNVSPMRVMRLMANSQNIKEISVATVSTVGETLSSGEFTFLLYDGDNLIDETTNDADGNITFSVPVNGNGIYEYTIVQEPGDRQNVEYDTESYPIIIAVEDNNVVSSDFRSDLYYGLTVQSSYVSTNMTYRYYMSTTPGNSDYRVLCIDHSGKPAPSYTSSQVYWVAEVNPSDEMIRACVCNKSGTSNGEYYSAYDGWCDSLSVNLKKMLYSVTYGYNNSLADLKKQTLLWNMTQGQNSVSENNQSIIYDILSSTTVPDGYQLVLFHPSEGDYQSFLMLLPTTDAMAFVEKPAAFVNTVIQIDPVNTTSIDTSITAKKLLDGAAPGEGNCFSFQLLDEEANILQTKQNDSEGNIVFDRINYTKAGIYNYIIREVNDDQPNIVYDDSEVSVSVEVKEQSSEISGKTLYSDKLNALTNDEYYYMLDNETGKTYHVYCLNSQKPGPNGEVYYNAIDDVSDETIIGATTKGTYENVEKIKKVLYYFLIHPNDYSNYDQQLIIWQAAGYYYLKDNEVEAICNEITSVPSNFHITYFEPNTLNYQNLIMGYLTEEPIITYETTVSGEAVFNNTTDIPEKVPVTIKAAKLVDGKIPGNDHVFTFDLYENGVKVAETNNDEYGNVVFSHSFLVEGTHSYTVKEVNDGQEGITYDINSYTVTVSVKAKDFYDLDADAYYSVQGTDYGYYVSKIQGNTDFPVQSIDVMKTAPTMVGSTSAYRSLKEPDSSVLAKYVNANRYGEKLSENLRKLFYYFDTHEMSDSEKKNYMFAATTQYSDAYDILLNEIYSQEIPDDYHLVLFVPDEDSMQPLLGAYGAGILYPGKIVFKNSALSHTCYELPQTGGSGTKIPALIGLLISIVSFMIYIFCFKRRIISRGKTTTTGSYPASRHLNTEGKKHK